MSQWTEINGSPNYRKGPGAVRTLTRLFHADKDTGLAQAAAAGYIQGAAQVYDGETLYLSQINPYNDDGRDLVQIVWENISPNEAANRDDTFNDGSRRYHGEEEWTWSGGLESETITAQTRDLAGSLAWQSAMVGYKIGDQLLVPGVHLVWKKWFRSTLLVPLPGDLIAPHTVPRTRADAIAAIETYLPNYTGDYEGFGAGLCPKIGKRLGATGLEIHFICSDVGVEPDGPLVCRTAQFRYTRDPVGWLVPPYVE